MDKKSRIYKKFLAKQEYAGSYDGNFKFMKLTFLRTYNKKCSICKFNDSCRNYKIYINFHTQMSLYKFCSRGLNSWCRGKYILKSIEKL